MKPGKALCYRFLFPVLGVDCAQNLKKIQYVVTCVHTSNQ